MVNIILMFYTMSYTDDVVYLGLKFSTKGDTIYHLAIDIKKLGKTLKFSITDDTDQYAIKIFKFFLNDIVTRYCSDQVSYTYQISKKLEPPTMYN